MNGGIERETDNLIDKGTRDEVTGKAVPQTVTDWGRSVTTYIGENPEFCLALALVLGAAIGVVVKRR